MINAILLIIVGLIYIAVGIGYAVDGKTGMAIAFFAYALANVGLYMAGK